MDAKLREELLKNPMVIDEIKRHRWFESEKANQDIGFDAAAEDWMNRFAGAWVEYHMPQALPKTTKKSSEKRPETATKKRRAKSYV